MITEILQQARQFNEIITDLKKESSYYPSVLIKYYEKYKRQPQNEREQKNLFINAVASTFFKKHITDIDKVCYASTLVRIYRAGKWYVVHCVESCMITENYNEKQLLLKMLDSVYKIQVLYKISEAKTMHGDPAQEIDVLQLSEEERLINLMNKSSGRAS